MPTRTRSALVLCLALALPAGLLAAAVPAQPAAPAASTVTPAAPVESCSAQSEQPDALAQILPRPISPTTGLEGAIAADSSLAVCCQQVCDNICNGCHGRVVSCRPRIGPLGGCLAICGICPPGC